MTEGLADDQLHATRRHETFMGATPMAGRGC